MTHHDASKPEASKWFGGYFVPLFQPHNFGGGEDLPGRTTNKHTRFWKKERSTMYISDFHTVPAHV